MQSSIIQITQLLVSLAALLISATLTILVYRGTKQISNIQFWRSVRDTWMDIDKFALSNDTNLKLADALFHPDLANQPIESLRKRWFAYMALNIFMSMYYGPNPPQSGAEPGHAERAKLELKPLLRDNVVYNLTQSGVYPAQFEGLCRALRREQGLPLENDDSAPN